MRFFRFHSDADLVQRVLAGQHEQFAGLVRRHLPMAQAIAAARVGNAHDAEDIVQEAFLKAYASLDSLQDARKFAGWLAVIVRNACANFHRASDVRRRAQAQIAGVDHAAEPEIEQAEMARLLRARIEDLEESSREILLLHYYAGKSVREIALLQEASIDAVKKRLQRAREALGREVMRDLEPNADAARHRDTRARAIMAALPLTGTGWMSSGTVAGATAGLPLGAIMAGVLTVLTAIGGISVAAGGCDLGVFVQRPPKRAAPNATAGPATTEQENRRAPGGNARQIGLGPSTTVAPTKPYKYAPASVAEGRDTIYGRAFFAKTGEPVAGAEILLGDASAGGWTPLRNDARTVHTDDDGEFVFQKVSRGSYSVVFRDSRGYAENYVCTIDGSSSGHQFLFAVNTGASVAGRVYDKSTGKGIAGIEVFAFDGPRTVSAADGTYTLAGLAAREWRVSRGAAGEYAYPIEGEERRIAIKTESDAIAGIDLPMSAGIRVYGSIVDGSAQPLAHFSLRWGITNSGLQLTVTSDDNGNFVVDNMPKQWSAWYSLSAEVGKEGFVLPQPNVMLKLGSDDLRDVVVTVQQAATLAGTVVTPSGAGVKGAQIDLQPAGDAHFAYSPGTDESGKFAATVYPGAYKLMLSPPKSESGSQPPRRELEMLTIKPGESRTDLRYVYDATAGLTIAGRILDTDGNPLPHTGFFIYKGDGEGTTGRSDDEGNFVVTGLDDALYTLTYFEVNRKTYYESERASAGTQDVEVRLKLEPETNQPKPGQPIRGQVIDAVTGEPVRSFGYALRPGIYDILKPGANYTEFWGTVTRPLTEQVTDPDGRFEMRTYKEGDHTLLVMASGYAPSISAVKAGASGITIGLEKGAKLEGVVLDPQGDPVEGAKILRERFQGLPTEDFMNHDRDAKVVATSGPDGEFLAEDLPPHPAEYTVVHRKWGVMTQQLTPAVEKAARVTLQFPATGTLQGLITSGGQPAPKAGIMLYRGEEFAGNTWTDEHGSYSIAGLASGTYRANLSVGPVYGGRVPAWRKDTEVVVGADAPTQLDTDFPAGTSTLFGIATVDGKPITAIATMQLEYAALGITGSVDVEIGKDGSFQIDHLLAGEAVIKFPDSWENVQFDRNEITVQLPEGASVQEDIVLKSK